MHSQLPIAIVRAAVAAVLIIHGVARVMYGTVDQFGFFLEVVNRVPMGRALAWAITVVEIGGGVLFALGIAVVPLAAWYVAVLVAGIFLVHRSYGWFVVGAGRNGMELSVVLITCLVAVAWAHWPPRWRGKPAPTSTTGSSP